MLPALLLASALIGASPDPLDQATKHYHRTVESYRVTIRSTHADGEEHIRYYYKKPGFVRMEFIHPHDGTVLVYNPLTQRVRLWPFGAGHFPEFSLSPGNPLIQSSRGQRIDRSDIGVLFENIRILRMGGKIEILDEENARGHTILHLVVTGAQGVTVASVHRYELWLDRISQFPVKIISHDQQLAIIETVTMEDWDSNPALPDTLLNP